MNFGYDFAMLRATKKYVLRWIIFWNKNATSKMIFLPYCALHVLHRNWGKFKNDKRAKLYEDIMSAPLDIFSISLRRMDLQRILVREHTMHLQLFYLIGTKNTKCAEVSTCNWLKKSFVWSGVWVLCLSSMPTWGHSHSLVSF